MIDKVFSNTLWLLPIALLLTVVSLAIIVIAFEQGIAAALDALRWGLAIAVPGGLLAMAVLSWTVDGLISEKGENDVNSHEN